MLLFKLDFLFLSRLVSYHVLFYLLLLAFLSEFLVSLQLSFLILAETVDLGVYYFNISFFQARSTRAFLQAFVISPLDKGIRTLIEKGIVLKLLLLKENLLILFLFLSAHYVIS